eukprot:11105_1
MSSNSAESTLDPRYDPVNGKNLVPKRILPPFNRWRVNSLPTKSDFDTMCSIQSIIHHNGNATTVLLRNLVSSGYSIGKIYTCKDPDTKAMKRKLNQCWKEYQIVKHCGLNEYFGIYYDEESVSLIIHQQAYQNTLNQYVSNHPLIDETQCKTMSKQILSSLWRLHNAHYVHTDIKPDNIMQRRLDHLYSVPYIEDGWLLIDFNEIKSNKSKTHYIGTMGWSAPEIEYNSKTNVFTYASDIFAFGLIILYILFGEQPLQVPDSERVKYRITNAENETEMFHKHMIRKQVLTNWYYGHVKGSEAMMKEYLLSLYSQNKISRALYELLNDGILIYNPKKRWNCKTIYNHRWFQS